MKMSRSMARLQSALATLQVSPKTPRQTAKMLNELADRMAEAIENRKPFEETVDLEIYDQNKVRAFLRTLQSMVYGKNHHLRAGFSATHGYKSEHYHQRPVSDRQNTEADLLIIRLNPDYISCC